MSRRSASDSEKLQTHVDSQRERLYCSLNDNCGWSGPREAAVEGDLCPNCGGDLHDDAPSSAPRASITVQMTAAVDDLSCFYPDDPRGITGQNAASLLRRLLEQIHLERLTVATSGLDPVIQRASMKVLTQDLKLLERLMASMTIKLEDAASCTAGQSRGVTTEQLDELVAMATEVGRKASILARAEHQHSIAPVGYKAEPARAVRAARADLARAEGALTSARRRLKL